MEKMLAGKTCIVTGAGRGIGRATALLFAQEGGKVAVVELDAEPANEAVAEIKKMGGEAIAVIGDLMAPGMPDKVVQATVDAFGPNIDVIVNVAGFPWDNFIHKLTDQQFDAMMNIHVKVPMQIIRAASPYMRDNAKKEKEAGKAVYRKIINISSIAGTDGNPGQSGYSAGKAGIIGLTKTLSREWAGFNINVNCIALGGIQTRMSNEWGSESVEREGQKIPIGTPSANLAAAKTIIPMGRLGTVDEAAGAILFFASSLSDYVSGQVLKVAGGWF